MIVVYKYTACTYFYHPYCCSVHYPLLLFLLQRPAGTSGDPFRGFGDQRETVQEVDYRGLFKELLS